MLIISIGGYRTAGTIFLGGCCRFYPSCSEYADQAAKSHSFILATQLIVKRILRCYPGGPSGYDPVPEKGN